MLIVDNVDWPRLPNTSEGKTFAIPRTNLYRNKNRTRVLLARSTSISNAVINIHSYARSSHI